MSNWLISLAFFVVFVAFSYDIILSWILLSGALQKSPLKYNGTNCHLLQGPEACEDIVIHQRTGLAFMACGNHDNRKTQWYPPSSIYQNKSHRSNDTVNVYNIKTKTLTPLTFNNFDEEFTSHGIGIYEDPDDPNELYFFLINHKVTGSVVELFKHTLNTFELNYVKTFKHDLIHSPNDVAPISKDEFYITNDLLQKSYWKVILETFTARRWGDIVFHSDKTNTTEIVVNKLFYPNGIITNWDHSKIYVGTIGTGELLIYERKHNNKLELLDSVEIGAFVDNVSMDPISGELYLAVGVNGIEALRYVADPTGTAKKPGYRVIKVSNNTAEDKYYGIKYEKENVFEDDGNFFHSCSVAAVDPERKVMLLGSYIAKGIGICQLD